LFGVPPEEYWPYEIENYENELPAFCYSFAKNYQAINYVRLDLSSVAKDILLKSIKDNISKGFPCMFGFTVYNSIQQSASTGKITYPCEGEKIDGGHTVMAVGYDDKRSIKNEMCDKETEGALLIRNSWGVEWGERGCGFLPYDYVINGLAEDWWTLIQQGWVDTGQFGE
jgi:C1A family cysteine protease